MKREIKFKIQQLILILGRGLGITILICLTKTHIALRDIKIDVESYL